MSKTIIKEVKNYYGNDRLNKGYNSESEEVILNEKADVTNLAKKYEYLLPPIGVMAEYEEMYPGTLEKLMKMAECEQQQKFALEKVAIASYEKARKLGAVLGFFTTTMICAATVQLSHQDMESALIFAAIAFSTIFGISLFSLFKRGWYEKTRYNIKPRNENQSAVRENKDNKTKRFIPNKRRR